MSLPSPDASERDHTARSARFPAPVVVDSPRPDVRLVRIDGVLGSGSAARLLRVFDAQLMAVRSGHRRLNAVIVEISGLTGLDRGGPEALEHARFACARLGIELVLAGHPNALSSVPLKFRRRLRALRSFPSVDAALDVVDRRREDRSDIDVPGVGTAHGHGTSGSVFSTGDNGHAACTATATHYLEVNAPADRCYRWWRPLTHLPQIMSDVRSVEPRSGDADVTHWTVDGPLGRTVEWDAKIIDEEPDRKIAWKSLEQNDDDIGTGGAVRFDNHGDTTGVEVSLHVQPPGGKAGEAVAKLFDDPQQKVETALAEFKKLMEAGPDRTGTG